MREREHKEKISPKEILKALTVGTLKPRARMNTDFNYTAIERYFDLSNIPSAIDAFDEKHGTPICYSKINRMTFRHPLKNDGYDSHVHVAARYAPTQKKLTALHATYIKACDKIMLGDDKEAAKVIAQFEKLSS